MRPSEMGEWWRWQETNLLSHKTIEINDSNT